LKLELRRLDRLHELLSEKFEEERSVNVAEAILKVSLERSRLLGLYPQAGEQSAILNLTIPGNGKPEVLQLEFIKSHRMNEPIPPPSDEYAQANPSPQPERQWPLVSIQPRRHNRGCRTANRASGQ